MNSWTIFLHGYGPHHNQDNRDADRLAAELLQKLMLSGHLVEGAIFSFGGKSNLFLHPPFDSSEQRNKGEVITE